MFKIIDPVDGEVKDIIHEYDLSSSLRSKTAGTYFYISKPSIFWCTNVV